MNDHDTGPCEAKIVLVVGQAVASKKSDKITATDAHDLRMALYRKVNKAVDDYVEALKKNKDV